MKRNQVVWILILAVISAFVLYNFFFSGASEFNVTPERFEQLTKEKDIVVLDVRSKFEFGGDKIPGAQNISYTASDFRERVGQLDKDKTFLVYCATGSRSSGASKVMKELGFKKIYNLSGGIEHWKSDGKPVTR